MKKNHYIRKIFRLLAKIIMAIIFFFGFISILMVAFSFTDLPYMAWYRLGTRNSEITTTPDFIVVMGAGGMPGSKGLMRCTYAAKAAHTFQNAAIIIAMPAEEHDFLNSDAFKMYREIALHNICNSRFIFEINGTNTVTQACNIFEILKNKNSKNLLIVTTPEHMYRSVLTFEKCGFSNVDGLPAFQSPFDNNLLLTPKERTEKIKYFDRNIDIRYNMWNYLELEIEVMREYVALVYYKIEGYI